MDIIRNAIAADTAQSAAPIVWVTEGGREMRMADITDAHLLAIIDFLEESVGYAENVVIVDEGTDREFGSERHVDFLVNKRIEMVAEAERRALIVPAVAVDAPQIG